MDLKEKIQELVKESQTFIDLSSNIEELTNLINSDIDSFLEVVDGFTDNASKEQYISVADAIAVLHYDAVVIDIIQASSNDDITELLELRDEVNALLNASDAPILFSEEDRDLIVIGKLTFMSLYYEGSPTDQNANEEPIDLSMKSLVRVKMATRLSSKKVRKHLFSTGYWHLLK